MEIVNSEEQEKRVREGLNKLYDMFLYTDKNMGKDDYTYLSVPPYFNQEKRNGIIVLKEVYDAPLKEPELHIKTKDLKAIFLYGSYTNIKGRRTHLYISKNNEYDGLEHATINDIFNLLDDFISNNQFYASSNNGIEIYDYDNSVLCEVNSIDLLNYDYLMDIDFIGLNISKNDIEFISKKLKKLRTLCTKKCDIDGNVNLGILPLVLYRDFASQLDSLNIFDYAKFNICLYETIIKNNFTNILHLDSTELDIDEVNINFHLFFLKTLASNLKKIEIKNTNPLNDYDLRYITGFYNLEEINIGAIIKNYDFLYKLKKLKIIGDILHIEDERELDNIREKQKIYLEEMQKSNPTYFEENFNLKNYLMHHRWLLETKHQEFYDKIRIPRIAEVKWQDKLNKDAKDILSDLVKIQKMPSKLRRQIGTEEKVDLIVRKDDDYLQKLGFIYNVDKQSNELARYQTSIYGPDGYKLLGDIQIRDLSYNKPILDASGNLLCIINYRNESNIVVPNHITEVIYEKRVDHNPNLTNYYEKFHRHSDKADYLCDMLISIFSNVILMDDNLKYQKAFNKFVHQKNVLSLIDSYDKHVKYEYLDFFFSNSKLVHLVKNGIALESELSKDIDSFAIENEYDNEEASKFKKDIYKYNRYMDLKNRIQKQSLTIKSIITMYFNDLNASIIKEINMDNIKDYFLEDIEEIFSKYMLTDEQKRLFKYYVLYLQERYNLNLSNQIDDVKDIIFGCNEEVGCLYNWPNFNEIMGEEGIDGALRRGMISQKDYRLLCTLSFAEDILNQLESKQENIYLKRIKAMYARLDLLNQLTMEDIMNIKNMMPIVNEFAYDKDAIYMDQILRYIDGKYPLWVERDMDKIPTENANLSFRNEVKRTYKSKEKIKIKAKKTEVEYYPF